MRSLAALVVLLAACGGVNTRYTAPKAPIVRVDHRPLSTLLSRYVNPAGGVDYRRWKDSPADVEALDRYLGRLAAASPESHPALFDNAAARLSYWINLYNAVVLREVLRRWPLDSVRDVTPTLTSRWIRGKGFFYDLRFSVGGRTVNLRDLENAIIRDRFADARVHFALNCASVSCPALAIDSFDPADLEGRLETATAAFVNRPANVSVDLERRVVRLSKIFEWYRGDFEAHARARAIGDGRLIDFVARYARGELRDKLAQAAAGGFRLAFNRYDWSLNTAETLATTTTSALIGKPLPPLELTMADGTTVSTASLRGRPLVLEFWASYCKPCRDSLPALSRLAERGDVAVIAVSLDIEPDRASELIAALGLEGRIDVALDPEQSLMGAPLYVTSIPTVIVVDAAGIVRESL